MVYVYYMYEWDTLWKRLIQIYNRIYLKGSADMKQRRNCRKLMMVMIILALGVLCITAASGEGDIIINETNFPDAAFREYVEQFDTDGSGGLNQEETDAVTYIGIRGQEISTLKGLEYFTSLLELNCSSNHLTSLDVSKNTALAYLFCDENRLTSLDVSQNTALTGLECTLNQLTSLDVSRNTALAGLVCSFNQLTGLDVSQHTALTDLQCYGNRLSSLDVNGCTALQFLGCSKNRLQALELSQCTALTELWCDTNQLQALDLNKCAALTSLWCDDNELQSLKTDGCTGIRYISCANSRLTTLDVSGKTELQDLNCKGNRLSSLNTADCKYLSHINCSENQLAVLDISDCTALNNLDCSGNQLQLLDVRNCSFMDDDVLATEYEEKDGKRIWKFVTYMRLGTVEYRPLIVDAGVTVIPYDPEPPEIEEDKITAFVTRCYELILGRQPDAHGLETWYNNLNSGIKAAAEIIDSFVRSNEFKGKNFSNADAVEILYKTMLGRGSDPAGKANWVAKLNAGQPLAAVINGFCGSNEFKAICANYGIRPGSVDVPEEVPKTPDEKIKAFVKRCYKIILGRGADEVGLNSWFNALKSRQRAASEIIDGFVRSIEFKGKNYSNEESVEILYQAMLGRGSDPKGKANWVAKLNAGQPLAVVINGFCGSQEFTGLCASYGIEPGRVNIQIAVGQTEEELAGLAFNAEEPITKRAEANNNRVEIINPSDTIDLQIGTAVQAVYINEEKAKEYVSRCYEFILGRAATDKELEKWVGPMMNGTKTADQIARGFLFSEEFKGKNVGNEALVKILYKVYLNREADPAGLAGWTAKLDSGMTLKDLLDALVKTAEYRNVISEMGK